MEIYLSRLISDSAFQQDDSYLDANRKFLHVMMRAHLANPNMKFVVFIHKAEVLSEAYRGGEPSFPQILIPAHNLSARKLH